MPDHTPKQYLSRKEASARIEAQGLPCKPETLARYASAGTGPAMTYFGRLPRYDIEAIDQWIRDRIRGPFRRAADKKAAALISASAPS